MIPTHMPLSAGTRLGPYEILSLLGTGGMGEVYRARDTRLDRIVAIKTSQERFTERFEREARAVAALNHPNICTLHDIGPSYLVMEFIDGTQPKGPLPLAEALRIGGQICDALDAAHRRGITHRDLKPGNILMAKSGVKLLDFGLAKMAAAPSGNDATQTLPLTGGNTLLGTLPYMAPEQLEGKEADARTDIFAFGAVLYELITGKRAFQGESQASLITAIMSKEAAPMTVLQPLTPGPVERVVRRCLAKDPDDRWQSARDLKEALSLSAQSEPGATAASAPARRLIPWVAAGLMTAVAAVLAALMVTGGDFRKEPADARVWRFAVSMPAQTSLSGDSIAVSPDGRMLSFAGTAEGRTLLWVQPFDSLNARALQGTEGATFPFWSPDSRSIGFFAQGKLRKVEVSGGSTQTICNAPFGGGGTWNRDGTILFAPNLSGGLLQVPAGGGEPALATALDESRGEKLHRWPQFLPDGRHFVYFARGERPADTGVYVGALGSGSVSKGMKLPVSTDSMAMYAPSGHLLFVHGGALMAQRFDADRLQVSGQPFPIGEQVVPSVSFGLAPFSVSANGVLAYRRGAGSTQLTWVDREGKRLGQIGASGVYLFPRLSPDGNRLAVERRDPEKGVDIWQFDLRRGAWSRFTLDTGSERCPIWSPDGRRIVFVSNRDGIENLYQKDSNGFGKDQLLLASTDVPWDWSADGQYIVYSYLDPKTSWDLWVLPLNGSQKPMPFLQTPFNEWQAQFSPNGRWLAYTSDESGNFEVCVRSFPETSSASTPGQKFQISTAGGAEPRWRKDGRELFYIAADGKLMAVELNGEARFQPGTPNPLFQTRVSGFKGYALHYDVSTDGKRFLVSAPVEDSASFPTIVEVNWTRRLK